MDFALRVLKCNPRLQPLFKPVPDRFMKLPQIKKSFLLAYLYQCN
jgi:hypothetical protein